MALPYDEATSRKIESFYKLQKKKPADFMLSDDGKMLVFKEKTGQATISLATFRDLTLEEREEQESDRIQKLAALDILYEAEKKKLRDALANYKATGEAMPVISANQNVQTIELQRVGVRSAIRAVRDIPNPTTNQIMFDEPYETRKLFGDYNLFGKKDILASGIFLLERHPFKIWQEYGRYQREAGEGPVGPAQVVTTGEEGTVTMTSGIRARIFYDPEDPNGYLSPLFEVEFIYKDTKYSSAYQAFESERMLAAKKPDVRASLLKTRSYRTIGLLTRKIKEGLSDPTAVWTGILNAMYEQHPELGEKLLGTGQVSLLYANPEPIQGGIGLTAKDKKVLDTTQWKGDNIVGRTLESIRARLREAAGPVEIVPPPAPAAVKESVVSTAQQATARKGAIIQARSRV